MSDNSTCNGDAVLRIFLARHPSSEQTFLACGEIVHTLTTIAVTESKLSLIYLNDNKIPVCRNAVTIQTKHHVIVRFPCSRCHDILCQVVISFRCSFQFCFAAYGLPLCHNAMVILICACRAADGMVNMLTFRHRHRNRHRCIQRFRNSMKSCHIQFCDLLLGQ